MNVARQAVALFENRLAPLLGPMQIDQTVVMQRERGLVRDRLDEDDAPPAALGFCKPERCTRSSIRACGSRGQRRGNGLGQAVAAAEFAHWIRQPGINVGVFDRLAPARRVLEQVIREACAGMARRPPRWPGRRLARPRLAPARSFT